MMPGVYSSEVAAVVAAGKQFNEESIQHDREFIGAIYKRKDKFSFSCAQGGGKRGGYESTARLPVIHGMKIIAIWHTHGNPLADQQFEKRREFSPDDVELSRKTNLPVYLITDENKIKVFHPNDSIKHSQENMYLHGSGWSDGEDVISFNNK